MSMSFPLLVFFFLGVLSSKLPEYPPDLCSPNCRFYRASTNTHFTAFNLNEVSFTGLVSTPRKDQQWTFDVSVIEVFKDQTPSKNESKSSILRPGQLVTVTSTCQDPTPYSLTKTEMLIYGNRVPSHPTKISVKLDPCPPVNWSYFDNSCKLGWLRNNAWSNCESYTNVITLSQMVFGLICGILLVTSLFATFCVWWFIERRED
eukprot:TRINITY_DN1565_c0_g3_i3.p1 TRINITY_DN1565_c0_g3~~TRINITY_DN1565_c0_g3_i3.p1  ORF type:complete len:204 (+),score=20.79 TRINITY_DN1565_c0_g3_i3:68-679(+)